MKALAAARRERRPSIPASRLRFRPFVGGRKRNESHRTERKAAVKAIVRRKAGETAQTADGGFIPPAEETGHSALPNALFLWGKAAARFRRTAGEVA
jgi:hypothetical protein